MLGVISFYYHHHLQLVFITGFPVFEIKNETVVQAVLNYGKYAMLMFSMYYNNVFTSRVFHVASRNTLFYTIY